MEQEGQGPTITVQITLSAGAARELLVQLATDDAAREEFETGSHESLVGGGITIQFPESIAPPPKFKLPPKWQLEDLLSRLDDPWGAEARVPLGHAVYVLVLPFGGITQP